MREERRKMVNPDPRRLAVIRLETVLEHARRLRTQQPYKFGVKASIAVTHRSRLVVGARTFPGNPYDGHIL